MRPEACEGEILRRLAAMPFLDRLEMAAVSGRSRGAVYEAVGRLEHAGLVASIQHAAQLLSPTRRYCLTASGLHRLARQEGRTVDELLRDCPVSEQGRRILMERLDAAAVVYRLATAVSNTEYPIRFRWYRAMPMDAAMTLPDGRTLAVIRQGPTADRTAFSKRLWRLRQEFRPSAVLMLMPDETRLRHARRLVSGSPSISFLALESDTAASGANARIWRPPSGPALLDLRTALAHTRPRGAWPTEKPPERASLTGELDVDTQGVDVPGHALSAVLKATEKRTLDLLSDWPWLAPAHLGELLGVKRSRLSLVLRRLNSLRLVLDLNVESRRRLALSDRGLAMLARRDRASVGAARKRWSASPIDPNAPLDWRNVSGGRSRQLLRYAEHTDSVHWFIAVLERQAHSRSRQVVQLDPPRRASRYFRHGDRLRSIHPDAFAVLRRGKRNWPFFLEWERRAVRPTTMTNRIAPYLRYYSSHRPTDDQGAQPIVLVVFEDEIAQTHFLRVARDEMERAGVTLPLRVSHRSLLERAGPLGRAWRTAEGAESGYAFASPQRGQLSSA